ncbi:MAG: hypothetical protein MRY83_04365, partial [Flavobacteriales bacterium]|nr:hypothetical protein [Flavobacteriales bacterium]
MNWLLYIRFGLLLVFLLPQISSGQSNLNNGDTATADTAKVTNIELIHADALEYDETTGIKAKKLIGNVHFLHDGTHMYCDSAYLFTDENSMRAYSNVRIDGSSGAKITGDSLRYNGNTKVAKMRGDIKLLDENQELTTNYLDFKIKEDLAYYLGGGVLINKEEKSTLISEVGYYYTKRKEFFFKDSVKMTHPDYEIISDTLMHNTKSERTFFNGPSTITTKESTIYCEDGWYDAKADSSILKGNAVIDNKGQLMYGDSIFYSRKNGIGEAFCNIHIIDTTEKMEIFGDYAIHYEKDSISIVTGDNALLIQEYDDDTLYLHGDTLISTFEGIPIDTLALVNDSLSKDSLPLGSDSISKLTPDLVSDTLKQNFDDSLGLKIDTLYDKNDSLANADTVKASKFRVIRAFHKVKFLKKDMQGKCDSLVFSDIDSTIQMHIKPIIWTDENQLSGDVIRILLYKGEPKRFDMKSDSFVVSVG